MQIYFDKVMVWLLMIFWKLNLLFAHVQVISSNMVWYKGEDKITDDELLNSQQPIHHSFNH